MFTKPKTTLKRKPSHSEITDVCGDVTNSRLDDKLPLASLWLFLVEDILSKDRIQNYSFFLISRKMKPREM